jgi:hypothetical protein
MPEQNWSTLRDTGTCHLVVVEAAATDLKAVLDVVCAAGDYALDAVPDDMPDRACIAFTHFADVERFTGALQGVRPVRQLEPRWSSQWDGVYDEAALRRLAADVRWNRRVAKQGTGTAPAG